MTQNLTTALVNKSPEQTQRTHLYDTNCMQTEKQGVQVREGGEGKWKGSEGVQVKVQGRGRWGGLNLGSYHPFNNSYLEV